MLIGTDDNTSVITIGKYLSTILIYSYIGNSIFFNNEKGIDSEYGLVIGAWSTWITIGGYLTTNILFNKKIQVIGWIQSWDNITAMDTAIASDKRLKENIKNIENNIFDNLKPVQYNWNEKIEWKKGDFDVGFIAQDL